MTGTRAHIPAPQEDCRSIVVDSDTFSTSTVPRGFPTPRPYDRTAVKSAVIAARRGPEDTDVTRRTIAAMTLTLAAGWLGGTLTAQPVRRYIAPRTAADATQPPFSGAVQVGDTLYLSGDIGRDAAGKVPDTAEGEAQLVLGNVKRNLESAGFTMDDLVSVQVFCSDVAHYDAFNKVYRTMFKKEFPARAFLGSGTLLFGARFEVQGVAVKR